MRYTSKYCVLTLLGAAGIVATAAASDLPAIGQLHTREHVIVVYSAADGLLFTVKDHYGVVLQDKRSAEWLAQHMPQAHATAVRGIARPPAKSAKSAKSDVEAQPEVSSEAPP